MSRLISKLLQWSLASIFVVVGIVVIGGSLYAVGLSVYSGANWIVNLIKEKNLASERAIEYPLTHNKFIGSIVTGSHYLDFTCSDTFARKEHKGQKIYIQSVNIEGKVEDYDVPFRIKFGENAKHRFENDSNPNYCGPFDTDELQLILLEGEIELATQCFRSENAIKLLDNIFSETSKSELSLNTYDNDGDRFVRRYPATCSIKLIESAPCIMEQYLTPYGGSLDYREAYQVVPNISQNFEYFLCDHPDHAKFMSEASRRLDIKKLD